MRKVSVLTAAFFICCNVMPCFAAVDSGLVGTWNTSITNEQGVFHVKWDIKPDGKYTVQWSGPAAVPGDEGTLSTNGASWTKSSKFGPDSGTFSLTENGGRLSVTGKGGTLEWTKADSASARQPQSEPKASGAAIARPAATDQAEAKRLYEQGVAIYKQGNMAACFPIFLQAARLGSPDAQLQCGWHYEQGKGVARDYTQAASWYERAAAGGNALAMHHIGTMYERGTGVAENWMKAARFYQMSAEAGCEDAYRALGDAYRFGIGVKQNRSQAIAWYKKAAAQGDRQAAYDAHWLSDPTNNIGFLNKTEHNLVIANKLRFSGKLIGADPGITFSSSQQRLRWLQGLRADVDKDEAEILSRMANHEHAVQQYMSEGYSRSEAETKAPW